MMIFFKKLLLSINVFCYLMKRTLSMFQVNCVVFKRHFLTFKTTKNDPCFRLKYHLFELKKNPTNTLPFFFFPKALLISVVIYFITVVCLELNCMELM